MAKKIKEEESEEEDTEIEEEPLSIAEQIDIDLQKTSMEKELRVAQAGAHGITIEISEGALKQVIDLLANRSYMENIRTGSLLSTIQNIVPQLGDYIIDSMNQLNKPEEPTTIKKEEE